MTIEAKPPVRRGPGGGTVVLAILGAALCVPLLIVGAVTLSYFFARSTRTEHVVYASPAYHDVASYSTISPEFEARLNAAHRIQMTGERDAALAVLAAEFSGNTDEANRAIQGIQDTGARDTAAWDAARRFSKNNRPQDSVKMIEMMLDQSRRDAGFRAVATGDWPERPNVTKTVAPENATTEAIGYTTETVADEIVVAEQAEEAVTEAAGEVVAEEEVVTEEAEEVVAEETAN